MKLLYVNRTTKGYVSATVIAALMFSVVANAQLAGPLTVGILVNQAEGLIKSLENTGVTLGGDSSKIVDGTSGQIIGLINELKKTVNGDLGARIDSLQGSALETSNRLQLCVDRLGELVNSNVVCLMLHKEEFLAAVQTVGLRLSDRIPFIRNSEPFIYSFKFDGHVANLVPKTGGRLTLIGYKLFEDKVPHIIAWDTGRKNKLAEYDGEKSQSPDTCSIVISPELIKAHQGENMQLEVQVQKGRWFGMSSKIVADLFMPFVVPKAYTDKIKVIGNIAYDKTIKTTKQLTPHVYHFENPSCEDRLNVSSAKYTYAGLPPNSRIVNIVDRDLGGRENSHISVSYDNDSIYASGWLDVANCLMIGPIHKLKDRAEWNHEITPTLEYSVSESKTVSDASPAMDVQGSQYINLAFTKEPTPNITYWVDIVAIQGNNQVTIYSSRRTTSVGMNAASTHESAGDIKVETYLNPTLIDGKCNLQVKIDPAICGY